MHVVWLAGGLCAEFEFNGWGGMACTGFDRRVGDDY